ncbi:hypothetical protein N9V13_04910 [Betaproteobacteria bacterium]|nr:hypothetical protein [Betaproteobacteria bacterium]
MKKVVAFIVFPILLSSCALNYGKESEKKEKSLRGGKEGVTVSCKPQREILVEGKCIKRRKYM